MALVGTKIGNIQLVALLGQGGMGEVYAGFDGRLQREVALKALRGNRLDPLTRSRLLREARALSQLAHPYICAIHDLLEEAEGDFLVLERIHGKNLREALAEGIDPALKLRIAEQVNEALAAAHAKGIVHRDLKLSNVMLTEEGSVKVLDFGLALASGERPLPGETGELDSRGLREWTSLLLTEQGSLVGTAACMSPEQARGEAVTTASDIYSFGLLLQELLTGAPPYEKDLPFHLLLVKAREGDTLPAAGIDRDLASLIQQMKSPAPAERPTAVEIRQRLAWIRDKPRRRLRRAAAVGAVLLLAAGAVKYTVDLRRERDRALAARTEAERTRTESEEVARFLEEVFKASDPRSGQGGDTPARELLDQGALRVRTELRGQPLVRARLMGTIGRIYVRLGLFREAEPLLAEALALREHELGPESLEVAESLLDVGNLHLEQNRKQAEPLLRRSLALREKLLGPDHPLVAEALLSLGKCLGRVQGDWKAADPVLRRAVAIREKTPRSAELARALHELAAARLAVGDAVEAEHLLRRALALRKEILPPDHPDVASSTVALGVLLVNANRFAEALSLYQGALVSLERRLGPEHLLVALTLRNLGNCYVALGRYAEAEPVLLRSLAIREKVFGPESPELVPTLWSLARLYRNTGRQADLDAACARGLAVGEGALSKTSEYLQDLRAWRTGHQ